jgi:hypothetical protein
MNQGEHRVCGPGEEVVQDGGNPKLCRHSYIRVICGSQSQVEQS